MTRDPLNEVSWRVAFFPDCYQEVDGVANSSRQYEAFAIRRGLPFLTVHGGDRDQIEGPAQLAACNSSVEGSRLHSTRNMIST